MHRRAAALLPALDSLFNKSLQSLYSRGAILQTHVAYLHSATRLLARDLPFAKYRALA